MSNHFKFMLQLFTDTTVPTNLVHKAWAKQLWKEAERDNFFSKFTGEGSNNIIQVKTDLKKEAGDKITVPLVMRLTGAGVTGDNTLEGNEEQLQLYDCTVTVDQIRHAVRLKGKMEEQKTALDLRQAAKDGLKLWMKEKVEQMTVDALTTDPSTEHTIYAGGKTSEAAVAATDVLTTDLISQAARLARLSEPKIRRIPVDGKEYYIMLVDPYQARDLKNDDRWIAAQENCAERGSKNPIFTGMLGIWDGVALYEYENLSRTQTGAEVTSVKGYLGHALLLGCQAGIKGIAQEAEWNEKTFDYGNKVGFATGAILGVAKSVFNEKDFAVVQVITASAAD
ncbi:MAG: N4-gp56 family major capsid protein [Phascolarctobacterium sp.]|nr:MAG: N4-gp56 family major capsid protein [Phascolarctobacterium sp.]